MASFTTGINNLAKKYNNFESSVNSLRGSLAQEQTKATGFVNKQRLKTLQNMDPQWLSRFEVILYPAPTPSGLVPPGVSDVAAISRALLATKDLNVMNLNAQSITIGTNKFEYETDGAGTRYVKNVVFPESCTISFLENQQGDVRGLLERWFADVGELSRFNDRDLKSQVMVFNEDQWAARKNARILLLDSVGKPTGGMFSIFGMRPMEIADITIEHSAAEPLIIQATFAVDKADFGSMGGPIGGVVSNAVGTIL
jgi:hypothetical protein